ncbi:MAG: ComF family protein [Oscillospiraceae bacterium]|jgi:ComF family protein
MRGELLDRMVSLVFPKGCVLCGTTVAYDDLVCSRCVPHRSKENTCLFCGNAFPHCLCHKNQWAFAGAAAALSYQAETRGAVLQLKKRPDRRIARYLAGEMFLCLSREFSDVPFDLITEVPMHPEKLKKRGFNQGELLAAQLSTLSGIPHRVGLLTCSGPQAYQHTLSRKERFAAARRRYALAGEVKGETVLLVDDVLTTGATAQACALCLKGGGAATVYVLTAAATPLPGVFP